jgi:hypothetical protein
MPLVFYECQVPDYLRRDHTAQGGKDLSQHKATVEAGLLLRVMSAKEPIAPGVLAHHVSISIGPVQGLPTRRPTDDECKEALSLWSLVEFEEDIGGGDPMIRNFWEK